MWSMLFQVIDYNILNIQEFWINIYVVVIFSLNFFQKGSQLCTRLFKLHAYLELLSKKNISRSSTYLKIYKLNYFYRGKELLFALFDLEYKSKSFSHSSLWSLRALSLSNSNWSCCESRCEIGWFRVLFDQFRLFRPGGTYGGSVVRGPTELFVKVINYIQMNFISSVWNT